MQWRSHNNTIDVEGRFEVFMLDDKVTPSGGIVDAFGRLRISDAFTVFDSQHRYEDNNRWSTANTVNTSITHNPNTSSLSLTVDDQANSEIIRETKKIFYYQPGKSLLVMNTFVMNPAKSGLRQRIGYFNDQNGIFLEVDDTTAYLVLRSYSTGSVQENRIAQTDWNIDRFDGTQFSSISKKYDIRSDGVDAIDFTKSQIFWLDIEWLGVGDVRCGFVDGGALKTAHIFHNENINEDTYMTTACLPLRYEITNKTNTASSSTLKQICSTVVSEGGFNPDRRAPTVSHGRDINQTYTLGSVGTFYNLATFRLTADHLDAILIPERISVMGDSNTNYQFKIVKDATFLTSTGNPIDLVFVPSEDPALEYSITNAVVNTGDVIDSGFIETKGEVTLTGLQLFQQLERYLQVGGTYDRGTYTLAISPGSNSSKAAGHMKWLRVV